MSITACAGSGAAPNSYFSVGRVPEECPQEVLQLIRDCTEFSPEERPTAAECVKRILAVRQKRHASTGRRQAAAAPGRASSEDASR